MSQPSSLETGDGTVCSHYEAAGHMLYCELLLHADTDISHSCAIYSIIVTLSNVRSKRSVVHHLI